MKKITMLFGAIAAILLSACTREEPLSPSEEGSIGGKTTAYLKVSINAGADTRATMGDFDYGDEHEVDNASFYFYNQDGAYVTAAKVWNGGSENTADPDENVEFNGQTLLVLKDLNEKNAPAYLVTILNAPENFAPGATLEEMSEKLTLSSDNADGYAYSKDVSGTMHDYFTMSTSSYTHDTPANPFEYLTTAITGDHFLEYKEGETPTIDQINALIPVQIYVERLAAKVGVKCTPSGGNVVHENSTGKDYFELTVSAGNFDNLTNSPQVAATKIYVGIEGWGLNNLTKNSYMSKNITGYVDATGWYEGRDPQRPSASSTFRNYWANSAGIYNSDDADKLAHYSYEQHKLSSSFNLGKYDYCFENTNSADVLNANDDNLGKLATSVMIYAGIYKSSDGVTFTAANDVISYNGILFTESIDFTNMVISSIQNSTVTDALKYAKLDGGIYKTIEAADLELVAVSPGEAGEVTLQLTSTASAYSWFTYTGATLPADPTAYTSTNATAVNNRVKNVIANNTLGTESHACCFADGKMYYNVPIEHYRNATPQNPLVEGDYGVVRNHIYELNVTGVKKLGKSIFDPTQVIIPETPTAEDRYALGVKINILSWKVVKQDITL